MADLFLEQAEAAAGQAVIVVPAPGDLAGAQVLAEIQGEIVRRFVLEHPAAAGHRIGDGGIAQEAGHVQGGVFQAQPVHGQARRQVQFPAPGIAKIAGRVKGVADRHQALHLGDPVALAGQGHRALFGKPALPGQFGAPGAVRLQFGIADIGLVVGQIDRGDKIAKVELCHLAFNVEAQLVLFAGVIADRQGRLGKRKMPGAAGVATLAQPRGFVFQPALHGQFRIGHIDPGGGKLGAAFLHPGVGDRQDHHFEARAIVLLQLQIGIEGVERALGGQLQAVLFAKFPVQHRAGNGFDGFFAVEDPRGGLRTGIVNAGGEEPVMGHSAVAQADELQVHGLVQGQAVIAAKFRALVMGFDDIVVKPQERQGAARQWFLHERGLVPVKALVSGLGVQMQEAAIIKLLFEIEGRLPEAEKALRKFIAVLAQCAWRRKAALDARCAERPALAQQAKRDAGALDGGIVDKLAIDDDAAARIGRGQGPVVLCCFLPLLEHHIDHPAEAAHVDIGRRAANQLDMIDPVGGDALQDVFQRVGLGAGPLAINQHIARRAAKAAHAVAVIDGETRHLADHVQRRDRVIASKKLWRVNRNALIGIRTGRNVLHPLRGNGSRTGEEDDRKAQGQMGNTGFQGKTNRISHSRKRIQGASVLHAKRDANRLIFCNAQNA